MKCSVFFNRVLVVVLSAALYFSVSVPVFADVADWADKFFSSYPNIYSVIKAVSTQASADNFAKLNTSAAAWRKVISEYNIPKDELRELFDICWNADSNTFISKYGDSAYSNHFDNCQNLVKVTISTLGSTSLDDFFNVCLYGNSGAEFDNDNSVKVPAPAFKDHIQKTNSWYYPKNTTNRTSYRTDSFYENNTCDSNTNGWSGGSFLLYTLEGNFCNAGLGYDREVWLCPFYTDGTDFFYGQEQLHIFLELGNDDNGNSCTFVKYELYNVYNNPSSPVLVVDGVFTSLYSPSFLAIELYYATNTIYSYSDRSNFLLRKGGTYSKGWVNFTDDFYSSTTSVKKYSISNSNNSTYHFIRKTWSQHDSQCSLGKLDDYGYVFSNEMISFNYAVDTTKIPDNYYVTISNDSSTGDTIYNYTLVNPETGQKDTIQNYITNNYTFTTNNEGDTNISGGGGSGGGLGGDVTVGGNVEVGGKVDINVNVNSGGNGSGNDISNDSEFEGDLNDYIQYIPEVSEGFIDYLKNFFSWLPPPVFGILMLGLIVSVWCRWRGR